MFYIIIDIVRDPCTKISQKVGTFNKNERQNAAGTEGLPISELIYS